MSKTVQGIRADLRGVKQRLIIWLLKILLGNRHLKSPVDVLWDMIDEENSKDVTFDDGPDCIKIEAWQEAATRINRECFGVEG